MEMIMYLEMREAILKGLYNERLIELFNTMPHLTISEMQELEILQFELDNFKNSEL
mgnify:CR=1 FL=1